MPVTVRTYLSTDAEPFRRLNEEWIERHFRLEEKDRETLRVPQKIIDAGGQIVMAYLDDEAVGCCALLRMDDHSFEVAKMAVTLHHQGQGFGRAILAATIDEARKLGAKRLYLETNSSLTPAITLYRSLGFRDIPADRARKSPYVRADVFMEMFL
jgi:GNAT superfamily N-acetyltransferase